VAAYAPGRGDLIWLQFNPQAAMSRRGTAQVKSLDWRVREARRIGRLPADLLEEAVGEILALIVPAGAR
jgi:mRNA-degrading endonuclease toxin of MazEF toxin-antitoxin module